MVGCVYTAEGRRREARRQTGPLPVSNVGGRRRTTVNCAGGADRGGGDMELIRLKSESDVEDASTPVAADVAVAARSDNDDDADTVHVDDRD